MMRSLVSRSQSAVRGPCNHISRRCVSASSNATPKPPSTPVSRHWERKHRNAASPRVSAVAAYPPKEYWEQLQQHFKPYQTPNPRTVVKSWATGEPLGEIELDPDVWAAPIRVDLVKRVIVWQRARRRPPARPTKTRAEVAGTSKKARNQKGGGVARMGAAKKVGHHRGGGKAFGPRFRYFRFPLMRKVRRQAVKVALSAKYLEGNLTIVDAARMDTYRTKELLNLWKMHDWERTMLIDSNLIQQNFFLASRNVSNLSVFTTSRANCEAIVQHPHLVVTLAGVRHLQARLQRAPLAEPFRLEPAPLLDPETGEERLWDHHTAMARKRKEEKKVARREAWAERQEKRWQYVLAEWESEKAQRAAQREKLENLETSGDAQGLRQFQESMEQDLEAVLEEEEVAQEQDSLTAEDLAIDVDELEESEETEPRKDT